MIIREESEKIPLVIFYNHSEITKYTAEFNTRETEILDHINQKIAAADSLEDIINLLLNAGQGVIETDRLCLTFLEEEGMRAFSRVVKTSYEPVLLRKGYSQDIREGSLREVIRNQYPRVITDMSAYSEKHPESKTARLLAEEGVRSSMTCPLMVNNKITGLLFRNSRKENVYSLHQVMIHLAAAERISQAVEKAYRIYQLEETNRNYIEMLGFVSHELKSPVGSIVMDSNLMIEGYLGELNDRQLEKLKVIAGKGEYLLSMIEDYLNLNRIENAELEAEIKPDIDYAAEVIQPALSMLSAQLQEKEIQVEFLVSTQKNTVSCDPGLMKMVLTNLISNGIKYGNPGGLIKIHVSDREEGTETKIYNTGPGFPAAEKKKLFKKFSRLQSPELIKQKGTGVGLYTVWRIIKLHGGTIEADSEEGQWAEFSFFIPG